MLSRTRLILAFSILLLAGCKGAPSPVAPLFTPQTLRLDITPSSTWILPAINECQQETPGLNLTVREISTRQLNSKEADLLIISGEPDLRNIYAVKIGQIPFVFIVNPANSVNAVSGDMLNKIFGGQVSAWSEVDSSLPAEEIQVWIPLTSNEVWDVLDSALIERQSVSRSAYLAPDPGAMLASVTADKYAIGILPQVLLNNSVKALIDSPKISIPIIAVAQSEPQGLLHDFLLCLQADESL